MVDHSSEHCEFCTAKNTLPVRKMLAAENCPTCVAWWDGYHSATARGGEQA